MERILAIVFTLVIFCFCSTAGVADDVVKAQSGPELFKEHCAVCHPEGGNIINPGKTLHKKDLTANDVKNSDDILRKMRSPGPGMTTFDKSTVSDGDAKKIAEYILATFK
jgi:cytochrome c6